MDLTELLILLAIVIVTLMILRADCPNNVQSEENYANANLSNEALGDIASIYNNGTLTATNITSTGTLTSNNLTATNATMTNATATSLVGGGIKLSNKWSSYPDNAADRAEISNDTSSYKTLMIVGNKSNDSKGPRRVGIWDDLTMNGNMTTTGNMTVNGDTNVKGNLSMAGNGRIRLRQYDNVQAINGWDLADFTATSVDDCNNKCFTNYPKAITALWRKNDKHCWCKDNFGFERRENNFTTTISL